ncbi:MAG: DUF3962 domain-containing protein [Ardenticatenales bacterium]|nr:DUF3962 domain-containing protein [Ardenticatenales bacterium]
MSKNKDEQIQPVAFHIRPDFMASLPPLRALYFPAAWEDPLRALQGQASGREGLPNTVPFRSINHILEAVVPYLLTLPRYPKSAEELDGKILDPWLVAKSDVPSQKLWLVFQAWLEQSYRECASFAPVREFLKAEALQWKPLELELQQRPADNKTARLSPLAYSLIPGLLTDRLVERGTAVLVGDQMRHLRRVPTESGAQLMTWPPVDHVDNNQTHWPYSYTLNLTVQTLVGSPVPRIHVHYGVRRWINRAMMQDGRFMMRPRSSVYLHMTRPWMGLPTPQTFTVARLEARYEGKQRLPGWGDLVPDIAQRLGIPFPEAQAVANDPMRWLYGVNGIEAAVGYKSPRFHPVQAGVDFQVHEQLTGAIQEALAAELALCPRLARVGSITNVKLPALSHDDLRDVKEQRLPGFVASVGPQATIEVWWQTDAGRNMLID